MLLLLAHSQIYTIWFCLLKAPYGGNTADPHFLDALRDCCEQVWTAAAHGILGFDAYVEGMADCGKSESRLICCWCTRDLGFVSLCELNFYVSELYAEAVCSWHLMHV